MEKGRSQDLASCLVQQKIKLQGPVSDNREQLKEGSGPWTLVSGLQKSWANEDREKIRLYL